MAKQSWSALNRHTNWRAHRAKKQDNPRYMHTFQKSENYNPENDKVSYDWI